MSAFYRELTALRVEQAAESHFPWGKDYVLPAFRGDAAAAGDLYAALNEPSRAAVAVTMWEVKVARPAFEAFFRSTWDHEHRELMVAARTRRRLRAMFRYAQPAVAVAPHERVRIWRGTSKLSFEEAAAGCSWTTSRDIACWFAMRFAEHNGNPLVLTAEVLGGDIVMTHDDRSEAEVVLLDPPEDVVLDADRSTWQAAATRQTARSQSALSQLEAA